MPDFMARLRLNASEKPVPQRTSNRHPRPSASATNDAAQNLGASHPLLEIQRKAGNQAAIRALKQNRVERRIQRTEDEKGSVPNPEFRELLTFWRNLDRQDPTPPQQIATPSRGGGYGAADSFNSNDEQDGDTAPNIDLQTATPSRGGGYGADPSLNNDDIQDDYTAPDIDLQTPTSNRGGGYGAAPSLNSDDEQDDDMAPDIDLQTATSNRGGGYGETQSFVGDDDQEGETAPPFAERLNLPTAVPNRGRRRSAFGLNQPLNASGNASLLNALVSGSATHEDKTVKKYRQLKQRLDGYNGEDNDSVFYTRHLVDVAKTLVRNGTYPNLNKAIKKTMGWSQADIDMYINAGKITKPTQVLYLNESRADERGDYEVTGGNPLMQGHPPQPYNTKDEFSKFSGKGFAIYVMSPTGEFYSASHKVGLFHHSSFLGGDEIGGAGEWKIEDGILKSITNKSGHYEPGPDQLVQMLLQLERRRVNLKGVTLRIVRAVGGSVLYPGDAEDYLNEHLEEKHEPEEAVVKVPRTQSRQQGQPKSNNNRTLGDGSRSDDESSNASQDEPLAGEYFYEIPESENAAPDERHWHTDLDNDDLSGREKLPEKEKHRR